MGSVYRAFDEQLKVEVALKVPQSLALSAQERFLEEAQRLAAVQHRNVVSVRSFGRNTDRVYFSMQLIDGPNGLDLIRTFQRQAAHCRPGPTVLEMAGVETAGMLPELADAARGGRRTTGWWPSGSRGAADGLDAAHRRGLLHRDVKPANFLMASDGRLLVADFGLAVTNDDLVGRGRGLAGTFPYVAPERLTGDQATIDQRADVWALGATLYEFLDLPAGLRARWSSRAAGYRHARSAPAAPPRPACAPRTGRHLPPGHAA